MIRQLMRLRRRRIIIDINTQRDFFIASGKVCIRNHRRILANVRRIMAWARLNDIPIISTCQVYPNDNGRSEIDYCLDGTEGQKKIRYALMSNRISFPADGTIDFPVNMLRQYSQVILHKRCIDPFEEPHIERLLTEIRASEFILIGADTENAVKATALGLLQRGKTVSVVADAVGSQNKKDANLALRKMQVKGARLIETKKLAGTSHLKCIGICDCEACRNKLKKTRAKVATTN